MNTCSGSIDTFIKMPEIKKKRNRKQISYIYTVISESRMENHRVI